MLNMSHELRTPLNWIIGASEMLAEEAADDGLDVIARDLDKISRAGRGLLAIISDVLDITQLESGRLVLAASSFSIADVVREIVEAHLPRSSATTPPCGPTSTPRSATSSTIAPSWSR